jgi:hypothetical protein
MSDHILGSLSARIYQSLRDNSGVIQNQFVVLNDGIWFPPRPIPLDVEGVLSQVEERLSQLASSKEEALCIESVVIPRYDEIDRIRVVGGSRYFGGTIRHSKFHENRR